MERLKFFTRLFWKNLLSIEGLSPIFAPLGAGVFISHATEAFFHGKPFEEFIFRILNEWWLAFVLTGFAYAAWRAWPRMAFACKLKNRDVTICLAVGNIFSMKGAIVVGSNTTFDTRVGDLISKTSVQGQFTKTYYASESLLDVELNAGLKGMKSSALDGQRLGKAAAFDVGVCVKVRPKDRVGYFLAISHINEHGVASGSLEDLRQALAKLWLYVGDRGSRDEPLLVPVLGTGFSRLIETREEVVREIIQSFIAACGEKIFCNRMTIAIHENDLIDHDMDFAELTRYVQHTCMYTKFSASGERGVGTPVAL